MTRYEYRHPAPGEVLIRDPRYPQQAPVGRIKRPGRIRLWLAERARQRESQNHDDVLAKLVKKAGRYRLKEGLTFGIAASIILPGGILLTVPTLLFTGLVLAPTFAYFKIRETILNKRAHDMAKDHDTHLAKMVRGAVNARRVELGQVIGLGAGIGGAFIPNPTGPLGGLALASASAISFIPTRIVESTFNWRAGRAARRQLRTGGR